MAIWNGAGEHLWRPLNNPPRIVTSSFFDTNPRGFGLSQRDRNFDHYLEGVGYHLRPSTWVEPLGQWGRGVVRLVEIPTDDEIHDNIVAYWVPEVPPKAGEELAYAYRLHWLADEPFPPQLGRVFATAIGRGGQPGRARPTGVYKFMVDFAGGPIPDLLGPGGEHDDTLPRLRVHQRPLLLSAAPRQHRERKVAAELLANVDQPRRLRPVVAGLLQNRLAILARLPQVDIHAVHIVTLILKPTQNDRSIKTARISQHTRRHGIPIK